MLTFRASGKLPVQSETREVARAIAGSRDTIGLIIGPVDIRVRRLRQAVRGAGVDWALIRQL